MPNSVETANRKIMKPRYWPLLLSGMATIAATNVAFMLTMIGMLSWQEAMVIVGAAAVLTGGALFTALMMRSLQAPRKFGS